MEIDQELLNQYFLKLDKDLQKDYDKKIKDAIKEKDFPKVIRLQGEKDGAFSALVCIFRGCLFENADTVPQRIKDYLKKKL
jgi:hypothetical protein